jgi:acetylornithine deacetylase/succinyl-diaminopimelate desuccinylase-like protein
MILEVERIGRDYQTGMATVSLFKSSPQNFCNIPSIVDFSFSMQHTDLAVLKGMENQIEKFVHDTAKQHGLEVTNYQNIWSFDPGVFDAEAVSCVEAAAKDMGYSYDTLCSHTGERFPSKRRKERGWC